MVRKMFKILAIIGLFFVECGYADSLNGSCRNGTSPVASNVTAAQCASKIWSNPYPWKLVYNAAQSPATYDWYYFHVDYDGNGQYHPTGANMLYPKTNGEICPSGSSFDPATGNCVVPCVDGTSVSMSFNSRPDGVLLLRIGDPTATECFSNCLVTYNADYSDCRQDGWCNVTGIQTGGNCSSSASGVGEPSTQVAVPSKPNCVIASSGPKIGQEICYTNQETGEGRVNNVPITANSKNAMQCVTVQTRTGPREICAGGPKNCGRVNGEHVCVVDSSGVNGGGGSGPPIGCVEKMGGSDRVCVTDQQAVHTEKTKTVTTNPDNSVTTTETETNNVVNDDDKTTETTESADGSTTTSTSNGGDGSSPNGDNETLKDIAKNTNDSKDLLEKIQQGQVDGNEILRGILGSAEDFDTTTFGTSLQGELGAAQNSSVDAIQNFADPYVNMPFSTVTDWLPSLPNSSCSGEINTTIFGRPFVMAPCEKLEPLRQVLAWVFALYAIFTVLNVTFDIVRTKGD